MYKVFINNSSLSFSTRRNFLNGKDVFFRGRRQMLQLIEESESSVYPRDYVLICNDIDKAWQEFTSLHNIIETAGGVVLNLTGEILMIYRLEKWDLPKGKMEKGEAAKQTALREVQEECGIPKPKIIRKLPITYHVYKLKGEAILKNSYWFEMLLTHKVELTPQKEENIEKAIWAKPNEARQYLNNSYASICWLLQPFM